MQISSFLYHTNARSTTLLVKFSYFNIQYVYEICFGVFFAYKITHLPTGISNVRTASANNCYHLLRPVDEVVI